MKSSRIPNPKVTEAYLRIVEDCKKVKKQIRIEEK